MLSTMTRDLAFRAGVDRGNQSMHAAGRAAWDEDDYNAAILMFNMLWPLCPSKIAPDEWCGRCDDLAEIRGQTRLSSQRIC